MKLSPSSKKMLAVTIMFKASQVIRDRFLGKSTDKHLELCTSARGVLTVDEHLSVAGGGGNESSDPAVDCGAGGLPETRSTRENSLTR